MRKARTNRRGFSLLELTLVIAIIGVLMAVAAVSFSGYMSRARVRATEVTLETVRSALRTYEAEYAAYPPDLKTLRTIRPPLLDEDKKLQDGWQQEFHYRVPGRGSRPFDLISMGEDKQLGTEDDINIWELRADR